MISRAHFPRFSLSAIVFGLAAGTVFAAGNSKEFSEDEKINGRVEGYFVRVKSRISGERQIYYNPDGTLKKADGDGLLGGDFSLDESLLSPESGALPSFDFFAPEKNAETVPAPEPAPADRPDNAVPAPKESSPREEELPGTVDEHSILKKFSDKKDQEDWGVLNNWKNIKEMRTTDRYSEKFSMGEWARSSRYGLRRYSGEKSHYEMRAAESRGNALPPERFDASSFSAGDRMFIRSDDGAAVEVLFDRRFSPGTQISASSRAMPLRDTSGFSMQDINRYQFRRNRSSESGIPVVSPDSGGNVRMDENFGKKARIK